jgi:hypothetical protein
VGARMRLAPWRSGRRSSRSWTGLGATLSEPPVRAAAILLLALSLGCHAAKGEGASKLAANQNSASNPDREVLKTVLGPVLPLSADLYLVVGAEALAPPLKLERIQRNLVIDGYPELSPSAIQAIADYHVRNSGNHRLPPDLDSIKGVRFISSDEYKNIFSLGALPGWRRFWLEFPGATALATLSLPGYSSDKSSAVVYFSLLKGDVDGEWRVLLLRRKGSSWEIEWSQLLAQS